MNFYWKIIIPSSFHLITYKRNVTSLAKLIILFLILNKIYHKLPGNFSHPNNINTKLFGKRKLFTL